MFYDKEIIVLSPGGYVNDDGAWVDSGEQTVIKFISCDVQPYSRELAYRDYGFNKEVRYRVFIDPDDAISLGTTVSYKDINYTVINIVDWDDSWELMIDDE